MAKRRRRSSRTADGAIGRRSLLLKLAGGIGVVIGGATTLVSSRSFTAVTGDRNSDIGVASEGNGIVGLDRRDSVKKQSRDPMVTVTNNGTQTIDVTVSLDNCTDGGLYDNDDESDVCTVQFSLAEGESRTVDIEADVTGSIPYSIDVSSGGGFELATTGSVLSESGNNPGAVDLRRPNKDQDFTADTRDNEFKVESVDIRDNDGDDDLSQVTFTVQESSTNDVVGEKTLDFDPPVAEYKPSGQNLPEIIQPDSGYTIQSGTRYSLTTEGKDADGNIATETVEDTA